MKSFLLNSGMLAITDPSNPDIKDALVLSAKKGEWNCFVETSEFIVSKITIQSEHIDETEYALAMAMLLGKSSLFDETETSVSSESMQIGFFDSIFYRNNESVEGLDRISNKIISEDEPWYSFCCDRSLSKEKWGVIPYGCVAMVCSDGNYKVTYFTNNSGIVVKVEIDLSKTIDQIDNNS
jgi:hypothetical protein